jgi:transposase-like protein
MPFKETCPLEERIALFRDYETGVVTVSDLCRWHGISRETFYVWKRRRESGNPRWEELSHAAASCPHATSDWVAVFAEVGLPGAIRSDNGSPFGSTGAGRLSALSCGG